MRNENSLEKQRFGAKISGIHYYLPQLTLSSQQAAQSNALPESIRQEKLGIQQVHLAPPEMPPSSLASQAIEGLCQEKNIDKSSLEFLIIVTQNPDYKLPTTACLVQEQASLPRHILAFDINQGCSGYVVALSQASSMIKSGLFKRGLVVTAEAYNRLISPEDKDTYGLFGDAAAATLVEACSPEEGMMNFLFGTDGSGAQHLIVKNGGACHPVSGTRDDFLYMNGRAIYNFVTRHLPTHIDDFLQHQELTRSDIDHWIFHQANRFMNDKLCSLLEIPPEKAFFDISSIGNTVSSSIPIALKMAHEQGKDLGPHLLMCGFGVGLSWGSCLYKNLGSV